MSPICDGSSRTGASDGFGQPVMRPCGKSATHVVTAPWLKGFKLMCRWHATPYGRRRGFVVVKLADVQEAR